MSSTTNYEQQIEPILIQTKILASQNQVGLRALLSLRLIGKIRGGQGFLLVIRTLVLASYWLITKSLQAINTMSSVAGLSCICIMCMVLSLRWSMNAWPLLSVRNHLSRIWSDKDTSLSLYSAQLMPWSPVPEALKHPGHRNQSQPPRAPHAHCAQQQQGENRKSWAECRGGHGQPTRGQWSGHVVCSDQSGASIRRRLTRSRSYDELFCPLLCVISAQNTKISGLEK